MAMVHGSAERVARIVFGAVTATFFGFLTAVVVHGRFVEGTRLHGARDAGLVAATLLAAAIAGYGIDQLLTGLRRSRKRWFAPSERALEKRLWQPGLRVGRLFGAPVRVHWSSPIGLFLVAGVNLAAACGFAVVLLVHEAGHALFVGRLHHRVVELNFHALGGECRWTGTATARDKATIAWGGVLAQVLLAACVDTCRSLVPRFFVAAFASHLAATLVDANLAMAAFNLLPFAPLDGADAWRVFSPRSRTPTGTDAVADMVKKTLERTRRGK